MSAPGGVPTDGHSSVVEEVRRPTRSDFWLSLVVAFVGACIISTLFDPIAPWAGGVVALAVWILIFWGGVRTHSVRIEKRVDANGKTTTTVTSQSGAFMRFMDRWVLGRLDLICLVLIPLAWIALSY